MTLKDEEPLPPSSEEESSVPSVPDSSEESSSDSSSDPEPQPVGPETKPFTPDDLTSNKDKRETVNDNECNWYTDKVLYADANTLLDGSRIFVTIRWRRRALGRARRTAMCGRTPTMRTPRP